MRRTALALVAVLLMAGCAEPAPQAVEDVASLDAAPAAETNATALPALAPEAVNATRDLLSGRTSLYWATDAALGDTVLEVVLDVGGKNECTLSTAVAGEADHAGPHSASVRTSDGHSGWGSGSGGGGYATAHAGPVDTRDVFSGGGRYGSAFSSRGTYAGVVDITFVALGVEPWDNPLTGDKSMSLDVDCAKPFAVLSARAGNEVLLVGADSTDDGAGANVFLVGSVGAQATASLDVTAPAARVLMGHFGDEAGRVVVDHPAGQEEWLIDPALSSHLERLDGGPGTYTVAMDRVGAYVDAFWLAAFGLDQDVDLVPGLQDEATYESPF